LAPGLNAGQPATIPPVPAFGSPLPAPGVGAPFGSMHTAPAFAEGALRTAAPAAGADGGAPFQFNVAAAAAGGMTMGTAPDTTGAVMARRKLKLKRPLGSKR
jgi:hypothetical protein